MTDADTTPLPRKSKTPEDAAFADVEVTNSLQRYHIHANGLYGSREYADLSLILRPKILRGFD